MTDAPKDGWLVHKKGRGWYRPKAMGYTSDPNEAGRFTNDDAMRHSLPNGFDGPRDGITIHHESEIEAVQPARADLIDMDVLRSVEGILAEADRRIAWDSMGFGGDFSERVEAALAALRAIMEKINE